MTIAVLLSGLGAVERLADRAAHDELPPEDAHRRQHRLAHHRLARAGDKAMQDGRDHAPRLGTQHPSGQHQRPGRSVDEHRARVPEMARPVGLAELVADQLVDGVGIGNAQQRLGEAQERHPLLRGQRVLVQQGVDLAPSPAARGAPRSTRSRARSAIRSRICGGISAAARICATARVSSSRVWSRIAARSREAGGNGAAKTTSISEACSLRHLHPIAGKDQGFVAGRNVAGFRCGASGRPGRGGAAAAQRGLAERRLAATSARMPLPAISISAATQRSRRSCRSPRGRRW